MTAGGDDPSRARPSSASFAPAGQGFPAPSAVEGWPPLPEIDRCAAWLRDRLAGAGLHDLSQDDLVNQRGVELDALAGRLDDKAAE
jgi:hypothetical protein